MTTDTARTDQCGALLQYVWFPWLLLTAVCARPCQGQQAAPTSRPAGVTLLSTSIEYTFRTAGDYMQRITITPAGELMCGGREAPSRVQADAHGQLSGEDVRELSRLLENWSSLKEEYASPIVNPPEEVIRYAGKTVTIMWNAVVPDELQKIVDAIHGAARRSALSGVPIATQQELTVGVTTAKLADAQTPMVFLMNKSDHPVKVFVPGFIGPVFAGVGEGGAVGVPFENASASLFGGDFVVLRPGEAISRVSQLDVAADVPASAYYVIYAADHEGDPRAHVGILHSDGRWVPRE